MRKPLACMRGFRGGVGEIGAGSGPSLKIQTLILHNFFFLLKTVLALHPIPLGQTILLILGKKILDEFMYLMNMRYIKSYVSSINLNTAILIGLGVSICFVSFDNFPFIFLLTLWLFVRIAFIQYVNV